MIEYSCSEIEYSTLKSCAIPALLADYLIEYLQSTRSSTYSTYMSTSKAAGADTADAEIGTRITNAISAKGTNQKALSDATGIAYPTLRRSLTGGRSFTVREISTIATALNIPAVKLLPDALIKDAA